MTPNEFNELLIQARATGLKAMDESIPSPMVIRDANVLTGQPIPNGRSYVVAGGVCGFAWVHIAPGNCSFAKWLMKAKVARKSYYGGIDIPIREGGQSMERKEAYARAMAKVLSAANIPGVKSIYADSRMD